MCKYSVVRDWFVGGLSKDDLGRLTEDHIAVIPQFAIPHIPPTQFNVSIYIAYRVVHGKISHVFVLFLQYR